jgi:uncharacterized protein
MRVGIDRTSIDQYVLTISQCQSKQVTYVNISYNQIIAKLQAGEIDAAIWNLDEVLERKLDIQHEPLADNNYGDSDTEAVIVVRESDSGIKALIASFIKPEDVLVWQRKIVEGRATPRY